MVIKKILSSCFVILLFLAFHSSVRAQEETFENWIQKLKHEAEVEGISKNTIQLALENVKLDEEVIELDRKQPESVLTFEDYLKNTITSQRIRKGRELMKEHRSLLQKLFKLYGVQPQIIIALWGIESSFGHNSGDFSVIDSLATLAYEGRRASFFRKELLEALHLLDEEGIDPQFLRGSWAGAMGQCQFMPSTFRRYAVDYDRDGQKDIWNSEADILASIANYLAAEGWQRNMKWGKETGHSHARNTENAEFIYPDGAHGRVFAVYDNFHVLKRWNRSTYFATAVGLLADHIAADN